MKMHSDFLTQVDRAVTEEFAFSEIIATHEEEGIGSERTIEVFGHSASFRAEERKLPSRTLTECFVRHGRKELCVKIYFNKSKIISAELLWADEGKQAAEMWIKLITERIPGIEIRSARTDF